MIIKSLTLHNFRQFVGTQIIEFSTDPQRKATLLIADNGAGKTTLLEAFSWILYGECDYRTIANANQSEIFRDTSDSEIYGIVVVEKLGRDYTIKRTANAKTGVASIKKEDSIATVIYKDDKGLLKELRGIDAKDIIEEMVPRDLFSYFFFQGENIEAIGREISNGKSGKNGKFVQAIRGMLGFNWLYNEKSDLERVAKDYRDELASQKDDAGFRTLQRRTNEAIDSIASIEKQLTENAANLADYREKQEILSKKILGYGEKAYENQVQVLNLKKQIKKNSDANEQLQQLIGRRFSSDFFNVVSKQLAKETQAFLDEECSESDVAIAGVDANAVEELLKRGVCLCGKDISIPCEEREKLKEVIQYLSPYNLGAEIDKFKSESISVEMNGDRFLEDHASRVKQYTDAVNEIEMDRRTLQALEDDIQSLPDIGKVKERERDLNAQIEQLNVKAGQLKERLQSAINLKETCEKEKDKYKVKDQTIKTLQEYEWQVNHLLAVIDKFIEIKEAEKRKELENAINDIFSGVFGLDIKLALRKDYSMYFINGSNSDEVQVFQNSTSQDAILAFAFIGGIIKLARTTARSKNGSMDEDEEMLDSIDVEPYPLVMDAPSSSFDTKRIESFCAIMPGIAEQVAFFIKDTDGLYVKQHISDIVGKEYSLKKTGIYTTEIVEVK